MSKNGPSELSCNSRCTAGNAFNGDNSGIMKNNLYSSNSEAMEEKGATRTIARGWIPDVSYPDRTDPASLTFNCQLTCQGRNDGRAQTLTHQDDFILWLTSAITRGERRDVVVYSPRVCEKTSFRRGSSGIAKSSIIDREHIAAISPVFLACIGIR